MKRKCSNGITALTNSTHSPNLINISLLFQEKLLKEYLSQQLWGRDVSCSESGNAALCCPLGVGWIAEARCLHSTHPTERVESLVAPFSLFNNKTTHKYV